MENQNIKSADFFKSISFICMALLAGMVLMGGMIYLNNRSKNFDFDLKNPFLVVMIILMIAGIFGSNLVYNSLKNKIGIKDSLDSRR